MSKREILVPVEKLDDPEFLDRVMKERDQLEKATNFHMLNMLYGSHGGIDRKHPAFLPVTHPDFEMPDKALLKQVVELVISFGYTKVDISNALGIRSEKNRTLNYWLDVKSTKMINKSNWAVLTALAGLTLQTMLIPKDVKRFLPSE